ncbi:ribbon-helix-helix protein, CopG family [Paramicrobacterium agarici]|uniref:Ribbon-helix-helix CopG family protein n=1 Tax=Paramicrobacterium agarici TaxID=630514 RepID=A0A2A9DRT1_9MICO|nr:ribbon-helix-helix protein, CopG family [Microbacterium agarici]PFG29378.1 ribbon-helix-helix CopG family protein [Microbacterium agarici]TQO22386.1 ribbon-helix-helix CopG family protein [Microbacterium agarici]
MATLEKRVQVLFDPEQYARLEAEARAERMSVGALIREAVDDRLDRKRSDARAALEELFARADENPMPAMSAEEWEEHKDDLLNRPSLMDIE